MSLHQEWLDLIENIEDEAYEEFWKEYSNAEIKVYSDLLENQETVKSGVFGELAKQYDVRPVMFAGFLDGVNSSLTDPLDLETVDEVTNLTLPIDFEKLYFNMLVAQADHLYSLSPWETVLPEEKRQEILKAYKRSKTIIKDQTPGRNDPCSCGSGKKYKKCCGA